MEFKKKKKKEKVTELFYIYKYYFMTCTLDS